MSAILGALAQGYSANHIVKYLQKNFPSLKSPIAKAISQGYAADKILDFLSNNHLDEAREQGATPNELQALRRKGYNKNFGRAAGVAASLIPFGAIARGLTGASSAALPQNPQIGNQPTSPITPNGPQPGTAPNRATVNIPSSTHNGPGPKPMANAPVHPPSAQQANVAQASQAMPTQQPTQQTQTFDPIGQDPEFKAFAQAQIDKGNQLSPESMILAFKRHKEREKRKSPFMKDVLEDAEKMKNTDFITPTGDVGTLKSERNGKALIDVNGKLEQFDKKDLESPPQELFDVVEKLLDLPEIEKSSVLSSLIYRPNKREMFVKFHTGDSYVYEDVSPEEMQPIADAIGIPVTSGQTVYGAWEQGKQDSRGAALITGIIKNPKYSKDQQGKTWEKLETKYDRYKKLYKQPIRKRKGQS